MFRFTTLVVALFALTSGLHVFAQSVTTLAFDTTYDNADLSLNDVACSDGPNGLETKYPSDTTLGSLPAFPNVGGVFTVSGYDSPACGTCYAVTYNSNTVNILAVDRSVNGFTVSQQAMNNLTNNQATALGRVNVSYVEVDTSLCNL